MNVSSGRGDAIYRGTARIDTARKILRNGWIDALVKDHEYTDDYKRDKANDYYSSKDVSADFLLEKIEQVSPKRVWVELLSDSRQVLIFYWSNKEYRAELNTEDVRFNFD